MAAYCHFSTACSVAREQETNPSSRVIGEFKPEVQRQTQWLPGCVVDLYGEANSNYSLDDF
jgi:hypothetical protein